MPAPPPILPVPQPPDQPSSPLASLLDTLSTALPDMNAEVAHAIAAVPGQTPDNALTTGQAAQNFTVTSQMVQLLRGESAANQKAVWQTMPASQQQSFSSAGYKPPADGGGLWHTLTHGAGHVLSDVLNAAGAPLRAEQHVERTLFAVANPNADTPAGGSWDAVLHSLHSASDWARAWDETSTGRRYILPQVERQVQHAYGDQIYQLAYKLVSGTDPNLLVKAAPTQAARDSLVQQIQSDPRLHAAMHALGAGHVTTGTMLARSLGIKPGSDAWNLASGGLDALLAWRGDPMVVGTKAAAEYKAAYYLASSGDRVRQLAQTSRTVQRANQLLASFARMGPDGAARIQQAFPKLAPAIPDLLKLGPGASADDVTELFADYADTGRLATWAPAQLPDTAGGAWIPHLSAAGLARLAVKGQLQKVIDFAADREAEISGLQPGDVIDHPLNGAGPVVRVGTRPLTKIGAGARRLVSIAPTAKTVDVYDPHFLDRIRDIGLMGLTRARVDDYLGRMATAADIGGKRDIYQNLIKEIYARLGVADTAAGQKWLRGFMDDMSDNNPASHAAYSTGGNDLQQTDRGLLPQGLLENHLVTEFPVPDFKEVYRQATKLGVAHTVMGPVNSAMFDAFMNTVWKPLSLARVGFALRVAGEEAFGALLRYGPKALIQSRLALSLLKAGEEQGPASPLWSPVAKAWAMLTDHLPPRVVAGLKTPADLASAWMTDMMRRAGSSLLPAHLKYAADLWYRRGVGQSSFADLISAAHSHGAGYLDGDVSGLRLNKFIDGKAVPGTWRKTGAHIVYQREKLIPEVAGLFAPMWHGDLQELAQSAWARTALETIDDPYVDRVNAVADALESRQKMASRARRWDRTDDNRSVAAGEASRREATTQWATHVVNHVDSLVRSPLGGYFPGIGNHIEVTPGQTLAQHLLQVGKPPSQALLSTVPDQLKPLAVKGPEMVPVLRGGTGFFTKSVTGMFDVIGRQINWISRQPMFFHNFAQSLQVFGPLARKMRDAGMPGREVESHLAQIAQERAVNLTLPYIHQPELRSQFAQITRNLMPFWFAQEQFYKRWARNMAYSPWAFRQAQLINQGVAHSGFVHKDPTTGQEYFVYPGANVVQDVLTHALTAFGYNSYLPIAAGLRGQVNQASPGLERLGLPSYGPLVVIPLNIVKQWFPETVQQGVNAVEGSQAASSGFVRSLVPTTVVRTWQDFTSSPSNSSQFASAMMQAVQYLEATGHGIGTVATNNLGTTSVAGTLPDKTKGTLGGLDLHGDYRPGDFVTDRHNNTYVYQPDGTWKWNDPAELAAYQQRVKNWTRIFLVTRTLFGFNAPASPENLFDPGKVNEDLQGLLKTLPLQDALATFMKEHPDANAYTVFQTATEAGDPLPATKAAMQFMDANRTFMDAHPLAGAYFIPAVDSSGKFDLQSYQQQLAEGLRLRKTPAEFWKEIAYAQAASIYFAAEDRKNALMNNPGQAGMSKQQIVAAWTEQSQQFMNANPLFAAQLGTTPATPGSLVGGESTTYSRENLLKDLVQALNDPALPQTQQTADIRTLVNSYLALDSMTATSYAPGAPILNSTQRYQIESEYAAQAQPWVAAHPDVQALYNRLVRPTLSSVLTADQQAAA